MRAWGHRRVGGLSRRRTRGRRFGDFLVVVVVLGALFLILVGLMVFLSDCELVRRGDGEKRTMGGMLMFFFYFGLVPCITRGSHFRVQYVIIPKFVVYDRLMMSCVCFYIYI